MTARRPAADRGRVSVFVGVGASRDAPPAEVAALVAACLAEAGLTAAAVAGFATVDVKADEPALLLAAERYGVPLRAHPAAALAAVAVPHPTRTALAAVGTPSVAEAAALLAAGPGARLVVEKRKSTPAVGPPAATCALAVPAHRGRAPDDASPAPAPDDTPSAPGDAPPAPGSAPTASGGPPPAAEGTSCAPDGAASAPGGGPPPAPGAASPPPDGAPAAPGPALPAPGGAPPAPGAPDPAGPAPR